MRICFMCQEDIVKPQGGTGTYVRNISIGMAARGHDVHVIARRRDDAMSVEDVDGVTIHRVDAPGPAVLYSPIYFRESRRKFFELHNLAPFDAVQGNMPLMSSWGLQAGRALPPIIETVHCTVEEELKAVSHKSFGQLNLNEMLSRVLSPVWKYRERRLLDRAALVISVSDGLKCEIVAQYGYAGQVKSIPNGVEYARFGGDPELEAKGRAVRDGLGIDHGERVILYLGRLMERKRVIDLVSALPMVLTRVPNTRLLIVGKRNSNAERIEEMARRLQVAERVTFVDHVPYSQVPGYYAMSDIYCLPSAYEGFPFTVLEAMAAGTPVIASDIPGIDEQITSGETGLLHPVGDIGQIARHILHVLEDVDFAKHLSVAGRKLVQDKYDWSIIGSQTEGAFRSVRVDLTSASDTVKEQVVQCA